MLKIKCADHADIEKEYLFVRDIPENKTAAISTMRTKKASLYA